MLGGMAKRAFSVFCLVILAGCQTPRAMPAEISEHLRGCWIEHRGQGAVTFRWFYGRDTPGVWRGEQIDYFQPPGSETEGALWRIDETRHGSRLCLMKSVNNAPVCWPLVFDLEAPRATRFASLKATQESFGIVLTEDGTRTVLFAGARDGCD